MNPELQEKIEKLIESGNIKELSLDNMASVSGGGADTVTLLGEEMKKDDFNKMMMAMAKSHGYQTACFFLTEITGHETERWRIEKRMKYFTSDEFDMEQELEDFWQRKELGLN